MSIFQVTPADSDVGPIERPYIDIGDDSGDNGETV